MKEKKIKRHHSECCGRKFVVTFSTLFSTRIIRILVCNMRSNASNASAKFLGWRNFSICCDIFHTYKEKYINSHTVGFLEPVLWPAKQCLLTQHSIAQTSRNEFSGPFTVFWRRQVCPDTFSIEDKSKMTTANRQRWRKAKESRKRMITDLRTGCGWQLPARLLLNITIRDGK